MVSLLGINKSDTAALTRPDATFNHYWINTTLKLTGDAHLFPIDHVFQGITTSSKAINVRAGGGYQQLCCDCCDWHDLCPPP